MTDSSLAAQSAQVVGAVASDSRLVAQTAQVVGVLASDSRLASQTVQVVAIPPIFATAVLSRTRTTTGTTTITDTPLATATLTRVRATSATAAVTVSATAALSRVRTLAATPAAPTGTVLVTAAMDRTRSMTALAGRPVEIEADFYLSVGFEVFIEGGSGMGGTGISVPVTFEARLDIIPAPVIPPIEVVYWQRVSETYPDPTDWVHGRPDPEVFRPTSTETEIVGRPFVRIDGVDMTYADGVPVELTDWSENEPWGWEQASLTWPTRTLITAGAIRRGAAVDIGLASVTNTFVRWLWRGLISEVERTEEGLEVTAIGLLLQTQLAMIQPPFWPTLIDSGVAVADAMNSVVSRRFGATARVTTGIDTATRGGRSDSVNSFVSGQLGLMTTEDGLGQWTLMPDDSGVPRIALKDRTTQHWTVRIGQRGVDTSIIEDFSDPNVIYGNGIDGTSRWDNVRFPGSNSNLAPPYPNASPSNTMKLGEHDYNTDNGRGITQLQTKLRSLGYSTPVDGYYSTTTRNAVRAFQANAGISVDGVVAGQTWGALWPVTGLLGAPLFLPLAAVDSVMPYDYSADGTVTGANPEYDPTYLRVERMVRFGEGVARDRAQAWAAAQIRRQQTIPNIYGSVTLTADPVEGSRKLVRAGQNIRLRGYGGSAGGVLLHINKVSHAEKSTRLSVDARARDALELSAIVARDRAAVDPALRILADKQSTQEPDMSPWSSEAPAGIVPQRALFSHLWSVFGVPVGRWGQIVRSQFATAPAASYAMIVFSRPVTSSQVLGIVGNPLAESSNGFGRIANQEQALKNLGMLIAWGQSGQAMGWAPGQTSSTGGTGTLTGVFDEKAVWDFASQDGVNLWVAVYADRSTKVTGRYYTAIPIEA